MATRGRPTLTRAQRRTIARDQLLQAVTALLADGRTYADLSINEMVAEASLAKSTFYQYFTGKNDLLRSLLDEVILSAGAADAWLSFDGPTTLEQVQTSIQQRAATYRPFLPLMAAAFDAVYFDTEVRDTARQLMTLLNAGIETHVRTGQAAGWIDGSLPPRETATWLNWMLTRGFHQLILSADPDTSHELIAEFSRLVWSILYATAQGRSS
jgi:TetR/AcrR family transcriptional regulator, ethionamide resistance regulator